MNFTSAELRKLAPAIAVLLGRPVKFCADRLESFLSDNHAREAKVHGRLAVDHDGKLMALDVSVTSGFGAYAAYPRGSIGDGMHAVHMQAAPYRLANFRGRVRGYYQNKAPSGILREVRTLLERYREELVKQSKHSKKENQHDPRKNLLVVGTPSVPANNPFYGRVGRRDWLRTPADAVAREIHLESTLR